MEESTSGFAQAGDLDLEFKTVDGAQMVLGKEGKWFDFVRLSFPPARCSPCQSRRRFLKLQFSEPQRSAELTSLLLFGWLKQNPGPNGTGMKDGEVVFECFMCDKSQSSSSLSPSFSPRVCKTSGAPRLTFPFWLDSLPWSACSVHLASTPQGQAQNSALSSAATNALGRT